VGWGVREKLMWPDSLRLASPERVDESKAAGQPTQQDTHTPGIEETLGTSTLKKPTVEEVDEASTPGKRVPIQFLYTCLSFVQFKRCTLRNPNLRL